LTASSSESSPARAVAATDRGTYFDVYKLAVEMADRISARRGTANAFFFTIHSALIAVIGFVRPTQPGQHQSAQHVDTFGPIYVAVGGVVLAAAWWLMLKSYRDLNRAKFAVINEMERQLPAQPFNDEWKSLKGDPVKRWRKRYAELGTIERVVPFVFTAIYVAAIVRFAT
jgi:hypothetical protein